MNNITAKAQILIHATPAEVYNAFVDPALMSQFWFTRYDNGLQQGHTFNWFVGDDPNAYAIEITVKELVLNERIVIEWQSEHAYNQVYWTIQLTPAGPTSLTIEEFGFSGPEDKIIKNALDSTSGFNQVVVAVKALLEHDATINVVADHVGQ